MKRQPINNFIIIGDTHCGCQFGLCPPEFVLDSGGIYKASKYQLAIWNCWESFWTKWVPKVTRGEPFGVIVNGDLIENRHHRNTTLISNNLADIEKLAHIVFDPIINRCDGQFYVIRGSEAHSGPGAEDEERLAEKLEAVKDENGNCSRYEMFLKVGHAICHVTHHIGITGSMAYESTALLKEYTEFCAESSRWGHPHIDIVVRSHRHRHVEVRVPTRKTYGYIFITAAWQLKTPFTYRIPGGRIRTPQVGGSLIRQGDEEFYCRHKIWDTQRPKLVVPKGVVKE